MHSPAVFPDPGRTPVELTHLRAPNARHFLNPDGTFTAEVFLGDIHARDSVTRAMQPIPTGTAADGRRAGRIIEKEGQTLLRFPLPGLPDGARIQSASVGAGNPAKGSTADGSTAGQQLQVSAAEQPALSVTELAQGWYDGARPYTGVPLPSTAATGLLSPAAVSAGVQPQLSLNYTLDPVGDQSFWTYIGGVNPFNGNLLHATVDLATPGRGGGAAVSRTYNSRATDRQGLFGYGWSANLDMHLYVVAYGPIVFRDASGTRHTFTNNFDGTFSPPPGIHYGLAWVERERVFKLTTLDDTVFTFSHVGLLIAITDANGQQTTLHRDAAGRLTAITDASGRTTTVFHNAEGFVRTITDPAGRTATYSYVGGNLTGVTISRNGEKITTGYGYQPGTHLLTAVTDPKGQTTSATYDDQDRVQATGWRVRDTAYSRTYTYGSDARGRRTGTVSGPAITQPDGTVIYPAATYTFNSNANLVQSDVRRGADTLTSTFAWDPYNNPISATDPRGNTTHMAWTDKGQPVRVTPPGSGGEGRNQLSTVLNYDGMSNVVGVKGPRGDVVPAAYDEAHNQTEAIDALGNAALLAYDDAGNLTAATTPFSLAANLLTNPGFEDVTGTMPEGWAIASGSGTATSDTAAPGGGRKSLQLTSTGDLAVRTATAIPVTAGGEYTLSAHLRTGPDATAALRVCWYRGGNALSPACTVPLAVTRDAWSRRRATNLTVPAGADAARVELTVPGSGSAWFDNVQLETGAGRWLSNTLANPGFDYNQQQPAQPDLWEPGTAAPAHVSIDYSVRHEGPASLRLQGKAGTDVYAGQQVDMAGQAGTTLVLSGWAKSSGATWNRGAFALQVYFKNQGGQTVETALVNFHPEQLNWHQAYGMYKTTRAFDHIKVYADYEDQTGTAWFDDFSVRKLSPTAAAVSQYNYVENASFELDGDGDQWPDGWFDYGSATFSWEDSAGAYTGRRAASIHNPSERSSLNSQRTVPYDAAKTYTAMAYARTTGAVRARLVVHGLADDGRWLGQVPSETLPAGQGWTALRVRVQGNLPAGTASLRVGLLAEPGTGTATFDNVRLLEGPKETTFGYDNAGNYLNRITSPLGDTVRLTTDPGTGNITGVQKPKDASPSLTYGYDYLSRLTGATFRHQGNLQTFWYGYDDNSNLTGITGPGDTPLWTFAYNELGQLTMARETVDGALQPASWWNFNGLGLLTRARTPADNYVELHYDNLGRPIRMGYGRGAAPTSDNLTFAYDDAGNLTDFGRQGSEATHLDYDELDRVQAVTAPTGHSVHYEYDRGSLVTQMRLSLPGFPAWTTAYQYDERGLPSEIRDEAFGKSTWYRWNEAGQVVKVYNQLSEQGISTYHEYDAAGRLTGLRTQATIGQATLHVQQTYDANGNIEKVEDLLAGRTVRYFYGDQDQLMREEHGRTGAWPETTITYTYDVYSNRTSMTRNGQTTTYRYSAEGNRLLTVNGVPYRHDAAGNLLSDGQSQYTWDLADRLQQVQNGAGTYIFTYDALGRRTAKTGPGVAEAYHYDSDRVAYITDPDGSTVLMRFVYGANDRPLAMHTGGTLYYYQYNAHGDVVRLVDLSGATVAEYQYDTWGNITNATALTPVARMNPYRYAGYWHDPETGLYYLKARYYKPDLGRFISQDSWGGDIGNPLSHNRYIYGLNDPVRMKDPDGRRPIVEDASGSEVFVPSNWYQRSIAYVGSGTTTDASTVNGQVGANRVHAHGQACVFAYDHWLWGTVNVQGQMVEGHCMGLLTGVAPIITGFTGHGINQAISRDGVGVSTKAILDAVKNPVKAVPQTGDRVKYIGKDAVVILNKMGRVITVWTRNHLGWRVK